MAKNRTPKNRRPRPAVARRDGQQQATNKLSSRTLLTLGTALAAVPAAQAGGPFTVTNLADAGGGSLRQAIIDANGAAGADIIVFQAGLTGTITLTTGQLAITDSVDIQGPGPAALTVSGNTASRVFYLYSAALIDVTISGLTITGGGGVTFGAGIVDFGENLELDDVVMTGNTATAGGGAIAATDFTADGMTLTIRNSEISGNDAPRGGGIYMYTTGGPMLIENSVISGNDASATNGGGIYLYNITDDLTITGSTISGNTAGNLGGGIYFYQTDGGTQTIDHSTLSGNSGYAGGGLAGIFFDTPFTIDHSTISGNDAAIGGGLMVIFAYGAPVEVVSSTISGNETSVDEGGGIFLYGLYAGGSMAVRHSTISSNTAIDAGGGIFALAPMEVESSIVGDNTAVAQNDLGTALAGDFDVSFSLVESAVGATVTDGGGNVFAQDPQLGALANNGGDTETHLPATTSPAVNAGDPAFVPPPTTDQRDLPRVAVGQIDMGAVELAPPPGTIQLTFSAADVAEAAGTVTITATRTGGTGGAVSVTVNSADVTAVAPGDYGAVVGTLLSWADGDATPQSLNINIVNDPDDELDEDFTVTISNPTGGAAIGAPATATITIIDDDVAFSVLEIPTVGEWGLLFLSGLLTMAGLYRLRRRLGLAAPMLVLTLMVGGATVATATTVKGAGAGIRDARAVTVSQVSARAGGLISLQLSDGTNVEVNAADLIIKDRRGKESFGTELGTDALPAGQPVVVKVRRDQAGAVKKVRIQVFATLEQAQAAMQRRQP